MLAAILLFAGPAAADRAAVPRPPSPSLHKRFSTGIFADLRTIAIRWKFGPRVTIELTPLHAVVVTPVVRRPTPVSLQYRTNVALEVRLR